MIKWILKYKTWTIFLILSILGVLYLGYINLWKPVAIIIHIKNTAGETINFIKLFIDFISDENILNLIKVLTPFLVPIITWKIKSRMDGNIASTTNKIIRDNLKIRDRRQDKIKISNDKRRKK